MKKKKKKSRLLFAKMHIINLVIQIFLRGRVVLEGEVISLVELKPPWTEAKSHSLSEKTDIEK